MIPIAGVKYALSTITEHKFDATVSFGHRSNTSDTDGENGLPPAPKASFGVVHGTGLPDYRDLDLSGILKLAFDTACHILRQPNGFLIAELFRFDHDTDLAARLQSEGLGHTAERSRDGLQPFQALDVGLEEIPPRSRSGSGNGIGRLDQHRLEGAELTVQVMSFHGFDHVFRLAVLTQYIDPQLEVGSLELPVDGFADIVENPGANGDVDVEPRIPAP